MKFGSRKLTTLKPETPYKDERLSKHLSRDFIQANEERYSYCMYQRNKAVVWQGAAWRKTQGFRLPYTPLNLTTFASGQMALNYNLWLPQLCSFGHPFRRNPRDGTQSACQPASQSLHSQADSHTVRQSGSSDTRHVLDMPCESYGICWKPCQTQMLSVHLFPFLDIHPHSHTCKIRQLFFFFFLTCFAAFLYVSYWVIESPSI